MPATTATETRSRRDVLALAIGSMSAAGIAGLGWPLLASLGPGAGARALATVEVDLAGIAEGQGITVVWRGKPVFVRRRTTEEIAAARAVDTTDLADPQTDVDRVERPEWLVVVGLCTHLNCVPQGQNPGDKKGDFGGWYCSCHGSHFDVSGRVRRGPAPRNLAVPPYSFVDDETLRLG